MNHTAYKNYYSQNNQKKVNNIKQNKEKKKNNIKKIQQKQVQPKNEGKTSNIKKLLVSTKLPSKGNAKQKKNPKKTPILEYIHPSLTLPSTNTLDFSINLILKTSKSVSADFRPITIQPKFLFPKSFTQILQ
eukprot:TRINITY_DN25830_c0_g1_i1.p1 TRINITY_DN25830_c0_g1~~TRINITY_DN25830_c0_g1_i1.p1  ORF type:complete len:132 (+),score=9.44 TRINITY_DN25830_c0_g1_i1:377-772(+)